MMHHVLILVIALAAIFLLLQWIIYRQAKRSEGRMAPDTSAVDDLADHTLRIYYFYSQNCGPCREMVPMVDQLREHHANLIKVDIAEHSQLARDFGIAGVPSFIAVKDGCITKVKLGRVSESWLSQCLTE